MGVLPLILLFMLLGSYDHAYGGAVFKLHNKFDDGKKHRLEEYMQHDQARHHKILSNVDFPVGGLDSGIVISLYFVKVKVGKPAIDYFLDVDTGSDITWISCVPCCTCPRPDMIGGDLTLYDIRHSSTASVLMCGQSSCNVTARHQNLKCHSSDRCPYSVRYTDKSYSEGYWVEDDLHFDEVVENLKVETASTRIYFGCGLRQSKLLQITNGILGLGHADTSLLSQLSRSSRTPNAFSHCLHGDIPGGILVIGHVVDSDLRMIPLVPHKSFYIVSLIGVDMAGVSYKGIGKRNTVIDTGTTFAYLPEEYFNPLISKIMAVDCVVESLQNEKEPLSHCFFYNGSIGNSFPTLSLKFEGSISMPLYPEEYLLNDYENHWCVGWQNSQSLPDEKKHWAILGDLVLKNKLFVYDLDKRLVGWKNYNCFSTVTMKGNGNENQEVASHTIQHPLAPFPSIGLPTNRRLEFVFFVLLSIISETRRKKIRGKV